MTRRRSFTQQEPIDEAAIEAAVRVLRSGRLHRYNVEPGETSEAALLETEYARWQGARYCLACASGGYAMTTALRAAGLKPGESVLTNGFTLAPVPGAIVAAGGRPALVEINEDLVIDLDDLDARIGETGARFLLLSNMRGHLADMEALGALLARHGVTLIEDCAHTMGAAWNGARSGSFGLAGCFSTQTYKHMNSGEGGLIVSNDGEFMARAVMLSGSYMFYERHGAAPAPEAFADARLDTPNMSGRMDNLRASILRPQIAGLATNIQRWDERYRTVERELGRAAPPLRLIPRPEKESFVGSSIQFLVPGIAAAQAKAFIAALLAKDIEVKWFGAGEPVGFTSAHRSWRYMAAQSLPRTDRILGGLFDMRLPLTFSLADCEEIGRGIAETARALDLRSVA